MWGEGGACVGGEGGACVGRRRCLCGEKEVLVWGEKEVLYTCLCNRRQKPTRFSIARA